VERKEKKRVKLPEQEFFYNKNKIKI